MRWTPDPSLHRRCLRRGCALVAALALSACVVDPPAGQDVAMDGGLDMMAPAGDHDVGPAAPQPPCVEDRFGPSTPELPAAALAAGEYPDLVLCPGQADTFSIEAAPGQTIAVWIEADRSVSATLGEGSLGVGRALGGSARAGVTAARLTVTGEGLTPYRLRIAAYTAAATCEDADEASGRPTDLAPDGVRRRALCRPGDVDWWRLTSPVADAPGEWQVRVLAGEGMWVDVLHGPPAGDVPTAPGLEAPGLSGAVRVAHAWVAPGEEVRLSAPGAPEGAHWLRVAGPGISSYEVTVRQGELAPPGPVAEPRGPTLWSPAPSPPMAPARWAPAAGLTVMWRSPDDAVVWAVGRTDAEGRLPWAGVAVDHLWAVAEAWGAGHRVSVGAGAEDERPWAVPIEPRGDGDWQVQPTDPAAPAVSVAVVAAAGIAAAAEWLPPAAPIGDPTPLHITWRPAGSAACGSCFRPSAVARPRIDLSGRPSDPDEGDVDVIRHEVGHFVAALYAADTSPGGRHDGTAVDPQLAWSEGFATFFASFISGDPEQRDWRLTGTRLINLEQPEHPDAQGPWAAPWGAVSDHLVAATLWDLLDDTPDEDPARLTPDQLFGPLWRGLSGASAGGASPGVDLLDYLGALACDDAADAAAWGASVVWTPEGDGACRQKAGVIAAEAAPGVTGRLWPATGRGVVWVSR